METKKPIIFNSEDQAYSFECPHCDMLIQVLQTQTNCCIFRCGIMKDTQEPINPHLSKYICDRLSEEDMILGCGKPFKINISELYAVKCDYI